jgi:hypothetical protein
MIGMSFSRQSEIAAASITFRSRVITSSEIFGMNSRRVLHRVGGVDPSTLVALMITSASISIPRSTARYRWKSRVAGAAGKDHHAPLLQVTQRAAADVRLGELLHPDRRQHARLHPLALQHVLDGEGVDDGREHPHVVGGDAVHPLLAGDGAPHDVAAADHQPERDAHLVDRRISSVSLSMIGGAMPNPCSPASASPEIFSRTRGYFQRRLAGGRRVLHHSPSA